MLTSGLTEPGGYLQWAEHDLTTLRIEAVRPEVKKSQLQFLVDYGRNNIKSE